MDHYKVDFNEEERVLHQLDFIGEHHFWPNDNKLLFWDRIFLVNADNITVEEEVEETPEEPEPEPKSESEPVPTPEPDSEPNQEQKSDNSDMRNPETEDTWEKADICADVRKEPVCDRHGFSTQQVHLYFHLKFKNIHCKKMSDWLHICLSIVSVL